MKEFRPTSINYQLIDIKINQFATNGLPQTNDNEISIVCNHGYDRGEDVIGISMKCTYLENEIPFLILEVTTFFSLKFGDIQSYDKSADTLVLPSKFVKYLYQNCLPQLRGILFAKTLDTPYDKCILPLMNLSSDVDLPDVKISPEGKVE